MDYILEILYSIQDLVCMSLYAGFYCLLLGLLSAGPVLISAYLMFVVFRSADYKKAVERIHRNR